MIKIIANKQYCPRNRERENEYLVQLQISYLDIWYMYQSDMIYDSYESLWNILLRKVSYTYFSCKEFTLYSSNSDCILTNTHEILHATATIVYLFRPNVYIAKDYPDVRKFIRLFRCECRMDRLNFRLRLDVSVFEFVKIFSAALNKFVWNRQTK